MNIGAVLKSEISRLARRELKAEVSQVRKQVSQHRSQIAALKREVQALRKQLKAQARTSNRAGRDATEDTGFQTQLRFRAGGFAKLRQRLGLSANDLGKLIGVSGQSVYHWEQGKSRPRASQLPAIAAVRRMGKREAALKLSEADSL
jgi:DNA-binding transcriptional regulator YiaG